MSEQQNTPMRGAHRFVFERPVSGGYGTLPVSVINIGLRGMQLEHPDPVRLRTISRISIPLPEVTVPAQLRGEVIWSRLSKTPNAEGKYLYRSGVRFEETADTAPVVQQVMAAYQPRIDHGAPERKGHVPPAAPNPTMRALKLPKKTIDPDRLMLIRQVRERLHQNPEEIRILAARARSALSVRVASVTHGDEELAIWEYLQRVVALDDIREALS